jgi:hypothetical protein
MADSAEKAERLGERGGLDGSCRGLVVKGPILPRGRSNVVDSPLGAIGFRRLTAFYRHTGDDCCSGRLAVAFRYVIGSQV